MSISENRLASGLSGIMNVSIRAVAFAAQVGAAAHAIELARRTAAYAGELIGTLFNLQANTDAATDADANSFKGYVAKKREYVMEIACPLKDKEKHTNKKLGINLLALGASGVALKLVADFLCGPTHPAWNKALGLFTNLQINDTSVFTNWTALISGFRR